MSTFNLDNPGRVFTGIQSSNRDIRHAYPGIAYGQILNNGRENQVLQVYDVKLLEMGGALISAKVANGFTGAGGVGQSFKLELGQVVIVAFRQGKLDDAYIIGTIPLEGRHSDYFTDGKIPLAADQVATTAWGESPYYLNGHPSYLTHLPSSWEGHPAYNISSPYDAPELHVDSAGQRKAIGQFAGVEYWAEGNKFCYAHGVHAVYAESHINITQGTTESLQGKLLKFALYHCNRATGILGGAALKVDVNTTSDSVKSQIATLVGTAGGVASTPTGLAGQGYFTLTEIATREADLCAAFLEAARNTTSCSAAQFALANSLTNNTSTSTSTTGTTATTTASPTPTPTPSSTPTSTTSLSPDAAGAATLPSTTSATA